MGNRFGSGILLEDGYVVTNAHVVWPYESARIVFDGGTEHEDVPVVGWDLMADLAVLGPLEGLDAPPLALADGEARAIASTVYLIGYPGEVNRFPRPTITQGIISRVRDWETGGITFFQTDATIAGGQSGGALISEMGEVIGISGLQFSEGKFALVASAADLESRIAALIAGEDPSGLGSRRIDHDSPKEFFSVVIRGAWHAEAFLVLVDKGATWEIEASSNDDVAFAVLDLEGIEQAFVDELYQGAEHFTWTAPASGAYFVELFLFNQVAGNAWINSQPSLIHLSDPDDGSTVEIGDTVLGAFDYPGDLDYFNITLSKGEIIEIEVDSIVVDPVVAVAFPGATWDDIVGDDNSGGGVIGTNARMAYQAPRAGTYIIVVENAPGMGAGGYSLSVTAETAGGPTPMAPPPTPVPVDTPFGSMRPYGRGSEPFTMLIPAGWKDITSSTTDCPGLCYEGEQGILMTMTRSMDQTPLAREQLVELFLGSMGIVNEQGTLRSRETVTTESGLSVEVVEYRIQDPAGNFHMSAAIAYESGTAFMALYFTSEPRDAALDALIDYSFRSIALRR